MTVSLPTPRAHATAANFLQQCLQKRLSFEVLEWLVQKCSQVSQSASPVSLYTAFSAAPKMVGRAALVLGETESPEAGSIRPLWKPDYWSIDQAARTLLLLRYDASDEGNYVATIEKLFSTADARELVALYQALPLLPHQGRFCERAAEGVRSNMVNVFHAIALNNPYPFEQFNEPAWNQMVLKVAFIGSPMHEIVGLDARANASLARMLRDLVHERRAADRGFPTQVWQLMVPYADGETVIDLQLALHDKDDAQRAAAAAALENINSGR